MHKNYVDKTRISFLWLNQSQIIQLLSNNSFPLGEKVEEIFISSEKSARIMQKTFSMLTRIFQLNISSAFFPSQGGEKSFFLLRRGFCAIKLLNPFWHHSVGPLVINPPGKPFESLHWTNYYREELSLWLTDKKEIFLFSSYFRSSVVLSRGEKAHCSTK